MITYIAVVASFVITALTTFALARFLSVKFVQLGITGLDVHKPDKPVTAEMGGLAVLGGVVAGSLVFYALDPILPFLFFAGLITILLIGVVGLVDDLVSL